MWEPRTIQTIYGLGAVAMVIVVIWFGRKTLWLSIPIGLFILLCAAATIPSIVPARPYARRNACISQLRQINGAKDQWAYEHKKESNAVPTDADLFGTNAYIKWKLTCPDGGNYFIGKIGEDPRCSLEEAKGHRLKKSNKTY